MRARASELIHDGEFSLTELIASLNKSQTFKSVKINGEATEDLLSVELTKNSQDSRLLEDVDFTEAKLSENFLRCLVFFATKNQLQKIKLKLNDLIYLSEIKNKVAMFADLKTGTQFGYPIQNISLSAFAVFNDTIEDETYQSLRSKN